MGFKGLLRAVHQATGLVFRRRTNILTAALISAMIFFVFILVNYFAEFRSALAVTGSPLLIFNVFWSSTTFLLSAAGLLNFSAVVLVSLLSGISLTMVIYKFRNAKSASGKGGFISSAGVFTGAFAASCPACSVALVSIFGVSGGLAVFPLKGLEFSLLSLTLLLFSIVMISKSLISCEECNI